MKKLAKPRFVAAFLAVSALTGCGGPYTGTVSGKVTYKGKPVEDGWVLFTHPDGRYAKAAIQTDGTYSSSEVPGGPEIKVAVYSQAPSLQIPPGTLLPGGSRAPANPTYMESVKKNLRHVKLPDKYRNGATSGLSLTVNRGSNQFDIPLDDGSAKAKGG